MLREGGLENSAQPEVFIRKQIITDDTFDQEEGKVVWDKTVDYSRETLRHSRFLSKQQSDHPGEVIGVAKLTL